MFAEFVVITVYLPQLFCSAVCHVSYRACVSCVVTPAVAGTDPLVVGKLKKVPVVEAFPLQQESSL